jgi:hypothetical protein
MLRLLAGVVRQVADMRGGHPQCEEQADAADCLRRLANQAARLPDDGSDRKTAQYLTRLAAEVTSAAGLDRA